MDESISFITRKCGRCGESFQYKKAKYPRCYCNICTNADRRKRYANGGSSKLPRDKARDLNYKTNYNFSLAEYIVMFNSQGGVCAVCGRVEKRIDSRTGAPHHLRVDHDHKTGCIRSLLCNNCNSAFGMMYENPQLIRKLLRYAYEVHPPKSKKGQEECTQLKLLG